MVVVSGPSASPPKPHKKNRRKEAKKTSVPAADIVVDSDAEDDADPTASTSAPPPPAEDDELMIDIDPSAVPSSSAPAFAPLADGGKTILKSETRRIAIPPHRMTPLKKEWVNVFGPLTEILGLQVRMNVQRKCVEIRTSKATKDIGALQKGADFIKAFALGFDVNDAIALLRLDDLYLDSFEIKDVKTLHGDHLSRAIGRIAGQDGKTKFTIENASRTRIVLADTKIHIMGSFQNIKVARDAIVSLILGSPPGKVYAGLRTVSSRMRQRAL
ncbi:Pre-rRNA-processing protein PNO1 [Mycena sanguinolenta]|uniref:Pre-rRNA-processing protein PNO1 n=1 Tax=Mycena sanguinolenta TaxID=230812 RepID=A0A8H6YM51_9AGAR|nr:Pre-rRNA-processing protein PNO1 [Mycena sanguinolenta]